MKKKDIAVLLEMLIGVLIIIAGNNLYADIFGCVIVLAIFIIDRIEAKEEKTNE